MTWGNKIKSFQKYEETSPENLPWRMMNPIMCNSICVCENPLSFRRDADLAIKIILFHCGDPMVNGPWPYQIWFVSRNQLKTVWVNSHLHLNTKSHHAVHSQTNSSFPVLPFPVFTKNILGKTMNIIIIIAFTISIFSWPKVKVLVPQKSAQS